MRFRAGGESVDDALKDIAGNEKLVAASTIDKCEEALGGCFIGLYRRDEKGDKIMRALKQGEKVPQKATGRLHGE